MKASAGGIMSHRFAAATFAFFAIGSVAAAQSSAPAQVSNEAPSASHSESAPLIADHTGIIPKGWPPPFGPTCHNTPDEEDDAHVVHELALDAMSKNKPHEALFYWRLAYVESCHTPKILVNIAIAAQQAGDLRGAIEALELYELRGTLKEADHVENQRKLAELREMLPKPVASSSTSASAAPMGSFPASISSGVQRKSTTNWLAISGFGVAGVGLASGLAFQLWGNFAHNDVASTCHQGICPPGTDFSTLNTTRTLTYVGYGVGIVGLGVGILGLTIFAPSSESPKAVSLVFTGNGLNLFGQF
jgi:hypothetical protein